nr:hypothetical protein [Tanacetum cinerariifolium]
MANVGQGEPKQATPKQAAAPKQAPPKQELQPHPTMDQLSGVQYCVNSPPPWKEAVLLGFQHYILTLGNTVFTSTMTISQMGGDNVRGLTYFTFSLMFIWYDKAVCTNHERDTRCSGHCLSFSDDPWIPWLVENYCQVTPLSVVPLVTYTGLGLYYLAFPMMGKCVEIGVAELYLPPYITSKRPICDRFAVLFSVPIAWTCAGILTWSGAYNKSTDTFNPCRTDSSGLINGAPWIYVPYPFQWGTPTFDAGDVMVMILASCVSSIEVSSLSKLSVHHFIPEFMSKAFHVQSTGSFLATARYGSATPGLGSFLGGLCGSVTGFSASIENCGALAFTRVGSRHVIKISAAFMIFFSVIGKFGAIFTSIPLPIAHYTASFWVVCLQQVYVTCSSVTSTVLERNSYWACLSRSDFQFHITLEKHWVTSNHSPLHTHSGWFDNLVSVVLMSHASVAVTIAMILDCTLGQANNENGKDWWEKFAMYSKDVRTNEFYKLPWKLNKFFPAI